MERAFQLPSSVHQRVQGAQWPYSGNISAITPHT
jgi:hypothetical protein